MHKSTCPIQKIKIFAPSKLYPRFAISDALCSQLGIELTKDHLPVQDTSRPGYAVIPPSAVHLDNAPRKPKSYSSMADNFGNHSSNFRRNEEPGNFGARDFRYAPVR